MMESNIILYTDDKGDVSIQVRYEEGTFWLTQKHMAELFHVAVSTVNEHLKGVFSTGELPEEGTVRKIRIVQHEGSRQVTREVAFYSLDAIIAVGYRVNSEQATYFRKWATKVLNSFITKGYVLDKKRLKQGEQFGHDYFKDLLEDIREIRASERRFYQKITDIFAQCSYDYDKDSIEAKQFYATVQNKLHWAITNKTAAEIIADRADHNKPHMGLTTWKTAPDGKIISTDVVIAKNYLLQEEISELNNIVSMFLDYAENQARRKNLMMMDDWSYRLDSFLQFNEYDILSNAGKISKKVADNLAKEEFKKYRIIQDREFKSDFDKLTASTMKKK